MTRPYWLTDAKTEHGVYLGFTRGQWPIQAFSADASHHLSWVADDPANRVLIGPIRIPDAAPTLTVERIPERLELRESDPVEALTKETP